MKQKLTITLSAILAATIIFFACKDEELPTIENTLTNKIELNITLNKVNGNSADLTCSVTNINNISISKHGICWNTSGNPTTSDSKIESGTLSGTSFNESMESLNPATAYYVKSYIIIQDVTIYSQQSKITTTDGLSSLTTTAITDITANTATSGGNISDDGGFAITARGVCWSINSEPTISDSHTIDGEGTGNFTSSLTGLDTNTTYYVRAYATNEFTIVYGDEINFTTKDGIPELTTNEIADITITSATSGGNITDDGGFSITARGVCWSTTSNPTITDAHTTDGQGTGSFISNLTGLTELTTYYLRAYATNSQGTVYGNELNFTTSGTPVTDYDGNVYETVKIGNQIWMAENLKTTHYADGTAIPLVENDSVWDNLSYTDKAMCYYDNSSANKDTYGALYTWAAAMNGAASSTANPSGIQGACPDGWHLPSDDEWKELEMYLGMSQDEADATGYRGTNEGSKLAGNESLWTNGDLDSNAEFGASGFRALPGGKRGSNGAFYELSDYAGFWSATEYDASFAWRRYLYCYYSEVYRYGSYNFGFSVRCLKD